MDWFRNIMKPIEEAPRDGTEILAYWPDYRYCELDNEFAERNGPEELVAIAYWKTNSRTGKSYFGHDDEMDDYTMPDYPPTHYIDIPTTEDFKRVIKLNDKIRKQNEG